MSAPTILAFDAATRVGWAYGLAGGRPISGSFACAGEGASRGAVFAGANRWLVDFLPDHPADILCIEAPIPGGQMQNTNLQTSTILFGLPAVIEAMCYEFAVYRQERVARSSVLKHFIGKGSGIKSDEAKRQCMAIARARGWVLREDEDQSFDRSDALATWSYAEFSFTKFSSPHLGLFRGKGSDGF
jgi:hypothetical protein